MKSVVVSIVKDDGYAAQVGIFAKDVIYKINGMAIDSPQAVTDAISRGPALFSVIRGDVLVCIDIDSPSLGVVLNDFEFDEDGWLERLAVRSIVLSTAPVVPGRDIVRTMDVVGAQCVYGVNALADLAGGIRDAVGGRSRGLQKHIADAREIVCNELRQAAHVVGGNAVIAVAIAHAEIGDKGGFMLMVTATGTAVVLAE